MPKNDLASLRFVQAEAFAAVAGVPFCSRPEQDADEGQEDATAVEGISESERRFDAAYRILPYMFLFGVAFWGGLLWLTRVF